MAKGNWFFIIALLLLALFTYNLYTTEQSAELKYSEFLNEITADKVSEVIFTEGDNRVLGIYKVSQIANNKSVRKFYVNLPGTAQDNGVILSQTLLPLLQEHNVDISSKRLSAWYGLFNFNTIFMMLIVLAPIIFLYLLLSKQMQGVGNSQAFNFGKSKHRLAGETTKVTFKDVAGVDEAIEELKEIVDFLKEPRKYIDIGAEIPKGVLLVGPPGCGKTLLAKAVAGEASVPFFYQSGSDFVEMFVGVGASRVRDLFDTAKKQSPCLVFVDEIDAVGRHRGAGLGGGHDEREQTLNALLVELDGFESNSGVILMAATNRPDVLDPALLRPGRFDRKITVDSPDKGGREEIIKIHLRKKPISADVNPKILSQRTPGFTGADLMNMCNEAALLAARGNQKTVGMQHFEEAIDRVIAGPERKSRIVSKQEQQIIAFHELGHAFVGYSLTDADPVHRISILPRGQALGYTLSFPEEDRFLATKHRMMAHIAVSLAGRVAEEIKIGDVTSGANNDFERTTSIARAMVTQYGMSKSLGPMVYGRKQTEVFLGRDISEDRNYGDKIANQIDVEVREIINECYMHSKNILERLNDTLDKVAQLLIDSEYVEGKKFEEEMVKLGVMPRWYDLRTGEGDPAVCLSPANNGNGNSNGSIDAGSADTAPSAVKPTTSTQDLPLTPSET